MTGVAIIKEEEAAEAGAEDGDVAGDGAEEGDTKVYPAQCTNNSHEDTIMACKAAAVFTNSKDP
jgi:hypothetical protein